MNINPDEMSIEEAIKILDYELADRKMNVENAN